MEHCSYCPARVRDLAKLHNCLKSRLYRLTCPSAIELGEYHLHLLPASRSLIVSQRLRECSHCTLEVFQLSEFLGQQVAETGVNLFGNARLLWAQLVSEHGESGTPALATLRGTPEGPILLEAEGLVITLNI